MGAFITSVVINIILVITLVSIEVHLKNVLSQTGSIKQELNKKIDEQNERIVNQNKTIVAQTNEMKNQKHKIDTQKKLIADLDTEIKNQKKKNEDLRNKILGRPKSCKDITYFNPNSASGIYEIEVDGEKLEVRCEMKSPTDVWTVLHNRYDGSVNFDRKWAQYEYGFGDLNGEFWLGLKKLNKLTKNKLNELRIEMSSYDGRKKFAEYKEFRVADSSRNYKLSFKEGSYSGNAGDSLYLSNGMEFSTVDKDHDKWSCY